MSKPEFNMPDPKNIPDKWKAFTEEAGVPALMSLARTFGSDRLYIPTVHYLLMECERIEKGKSIKIEALPNKSIHLERSKSV